MYSVWTAWAAATPRPTSGHVPALAPRLVQLPAIVNQQVDLALQGVAQHGKLAVRLNAVLQ